MTPVDEVVDLSRILSGPICMLNHYLARLLIPVAII